MITNEMTISILHAVFINQIFIVGEKECNYENYLCIINQSFYLF